MVFCHLDDDNTRFHSFLIFVISRTLVMLPLHDKTKGDILDCDISGCRTWNHLLSDRQLYRFEQAGFAV